MKQFIVMVFTAYEGWNIDYETDDFQEAVSAYKLAKFVEEDAMLVSPVKFKVLEDARQLDLFEEAQA